MILTKEEKLKLDILRDNASVRNEIEEEFWSTQNCKETPCHNIWSGQILPLIEWAQDEQGFNIQLFRKYSSLFDKTFIGQCDENIDIVRRALLTRKLKSYPKVFRGNTNFSFAWEWSDWQNLINENKNQFKLFLDDLDSNSDYDSMIASYPQNADWSEFVHKPYLIKYCEQKNIQWNDKYGWLLIKQKRATKYISTLNMHLLKYLKGNLKIEGWKIWDYSENRVVVENEDKDIVFDIWNYKNDWYFELFRRNDDDMENTLKPLIDSSWIFNGKRYEKKIPIDKTDMYSQPEVATVILDAIRFSPLITQNLP